MSKYTRATTAPHEQLGEMLPIPSRSQWVILSAALIFVGCALVWGVAGVIPTTVPGKGILIHHEGIFDVVSQGTGQVAELLVNLDDVVEEGQVVARISQLELKNRITDMEALLHTLQMEKATVTKLGAEAHAKKSLYIKNRRATLKTAIAYSKERLNNISLHLKTLEPMVQKGFISRNEYLNNKYEYNQIKKQIMEYTDLLAQLSATNVDIESLKAKEASQINLRVIEAQQKLTSLRMQLESTSRIVSSRAGRVTEIFKERGDMVASGESILGLEVANQDSPLSMVAYFSPYQGKMIKPGMPVQLTPSVVRAEEFGYIMGEVNHVSLFPASRNGMINMLGNEALVDHLSLGGAPLMVTVKLLEDPSTISGYKWSTGQGPPLKLQSGTLCAAQAQVRANPPLALVFPKLKKLFTASPGAAPLQ